MKYTARACSLKENSAIFPKVGNILLTQRRMKMPVKILISCNLVLLACYALAQVSLTLLLSFPVFLRHGKFQPCIQFYNQP